MTGSANELKRLRRLHAEASIVLAEWEDVWIAAGRPGELGRSKAAGVFDEIVRLRIWQQEACHWLSEANSGHGMTTAEESAAVRALIDRAEGNAS